MISEMLISDVTPDLRGEAELVCNNSTSEQQRCLGAGSSLVGFEVSCDGPNGPFAHFSSWMIDLSATVDSS